MKEKSKNQMTESLMQGDSMIEKEKTIQTLESFKDLPSNWNGYSAQTIKPRIVDSAIKLVRELPVVMQPYPTSFGTVILQLEDGKGNYLEIEFLGVDTVAVFIDSDNMTATSVESKELHLDNLEDKTKLLKMLDDFLDSI